MAFPGTKPKLKVVPRAEGLPQSDDFAPPLPLGSVGTAEWNRLRVQAHWIQASSSMALWLHCDAVERLAAAHRDVKHRGRLLSTRNGKVKNPCLQIIRECETVLMRTDPELGLTEASRQRMVSPAPAIVDPLEAALCG
jgi:phage terminase small subunit